MSRTKRKRKAQIVYSIRQYAIKPRWYVLWRGDNELVQVGDARKVLLMLRAGLVGI